MFPRRKTVHTHTHKKLRPSWSLAGVVAVISSGLMLLVYGEAHFDSIGFALVMTASALSGLRWTITQVLLQGGGGGGGGGKAKGSSSGNKTSSSSSSSSHPPSPPRSPASAEAGTGGGHGGHGAPGGQGPVAVVAALMPVMAATVALVSLLAERLWVVLPHSPYFDSFDSLMLTLGLVSGGAAIAFAMVWVEFTVIKLTSALTFMVAGTFKEIVTVLAAVAFLGESFSRINAAGLAVLVAGVALFNYTKYRKVAAEQREAVLAAAEEAAAAAGGGAAAASSNPSSAAAALHSASVYEAFVPSSVQDNGSDLQGVVVERGGAAAAAAARKRRGGANGGLGGGGGGGGGASLDIEAPPLSSSSTPVEAERTATATPLAAAAADDAAAAAAAAGNGGSGSPLRPRAGSLLAPAASDRGD